MKPFLKALLASPEVQNRYGTCDICDRCGGQPLGILHDGNVEGDHVTKESAFKAAVAAASLAIREGHEVHVSEPGREQGNRTATGAND